MCFLSPLLSAWLCLVNNGALLLSSVSGCSVPTRPEEGARTFVIQAAGPPINAPYPSCGIPQSLEKVAALRPSHAINLHRDANPRIHLGEPFYYIYLFANKHSEAVSDLVEPKSEFANHLCALDHSVNTPSTLFKFTFEFFLIKHQIKSLNILKF